MIAHLYLLSDSLKYNGADTETEILNKLNAFVEDLKYIDKYRDENKIIINPDIYEINISETKGLFDIMSKLERDGRNLLTGILCNSSNCTDLELNAVYDKCLNHNQNECSAIMAFNNIDNIDEDVIIVYDKKSWFGFRRKFLGMYPTKNAGYFIDECKKYFENLFFHENNKTSIVDYLDNFPVKIIKYLSDLNDYFKDFYEMNKNTSNINDLLKRFSITYNHDEHASLQGNHNKKDFLTFEFNNTKENRVEKIYCEPHLKISKSDKYPKDSKDYPVRIYFHFGVENVENGRILIGAIGPHVE
ncbi:MAG: hypothetical protein LBT50_07035 [Prevotellaceae bacterium]|jgi:hypothetical protein|nr:hypothetical protein [Prevotellaceae bacterium]